jgi:hypothetical protein
MRFSSLTIALGLVCGCSRGTYVHEDNLAPSGPAEPLPENAAFELGPELAGPCEKRPSIDVNLGNSPEAFVRAAHCQISGTEPDAALVVEWAGALRTTSWVRRIDVVRSLCALAEVDCSLDYSDPWKTQVSLTTACERKTARDIGAVFMFFSECPGGVNCDPDWANTHVSGMIEPHPLFAFGTAFEGYYDADNKGFWRRELLDARWAGLQFVLLNTYGPDLGKLTGLNEVLGEIDGGIQIAFMDDTWNWGRGDRPPWNAVPNMADTEAAAQAIYRNKWKPFYDAIDPEHWYEVEDRPFVYFYNAGTLRPLNRSAAVIARVKELFAADFGVNPFVAVDRAFFQDPGTAAVADSQFIWNTFGPDARSQFNLNGVTHDHFMVKWDSLGRDQPGVVAGESDRIVKGPELLHQALSDSAASDVAVFGTWNDLGEGTGINRNYDYYYQGEWLEPNAFMSVLRAAQCAN